MPACTLWQWQFSGIISGWNFPLKLPSYSASLRFLSKLVIMVTQQPGLRTNCSYYQLKQRSYVMPKISDIEETPNPNAVKFILREAVSNGTAHQYASADLAENDPLARSLFDVGHVVSVFYMDRMITIEKDDEGDWDDLLPTLAVPIRAAQAVNSTATAAAAVGGSIAAVTSDDPRLMKINDILDEKVRPALMGDGGYLEVLGLKDHTLSIRYQGACGSCPSSLSGTLMAIEGMLKQEIDPDLEVVAV
jgi:Fe-S cluster biogenesis protein NfuA